jgi:hypothetical protein
MVCPDTRRHRRSDHPRDGSGLPTFRHPCRVVARSRALTAHTQYDEFPRFAALFSECPALWHDSWGGEGYQADLKEANALLLS